MQGRKDLNRPRLVEVASAKEVWVDGFGNVENLGGGVYRIPLYKIHRPPGGEGPVEHEIVAYVLANLAHIANSLTEMRDELAKGLFERFVNSVH